MTRSFEILLVLTFDLRSLFLRVVINRDPESFEPRPLMVKVVDPFVRENLSSVKTSVAPSDLIRVYLSSSNGKNTSLAPAFIEAVELFEILVVYCLLIVISESTRLTDSIFCLGNMLNKASLFARLPDPEPPEALVETNFKF